MKWFKHDSKASNDAKLQKVVIKYGLEGYGLYWFCLELIAGNVEPENLTFELEHDAEIIAFKTGIHYERIQEMMTFMVDLGLFEQERGVITCLKLARRLDDTMSRNPQIKKIKDKLFNSLEKPRSNSEVTPKKVRLEEKRIDKNRSEKKEQKKGSPSAPRPRFKKPSIDEIQKYCDERNNGINAERFYDFYESKGWMVGKAKMKCWKSSVRTWEQRSKDNSNSEGGRNELDFNSTGW